MNIVVVGGGSAGWISALFVQKFFPSCKITVIDSSTVDIIGVGESTTPPIIDIFDFIGISIADLIKNCGATIKDSIRFTNWNGDGKSYHHGFGTRNPRLDIYSNSTSAPYSDHFFNHPVCKPLMAIHDLYHGKNLDELHLSAAASIKNKIPFSFLDKKNRISQSSIHHFDRHADIALHFNARQVAEYLKKLGIERGICHIDGFVEDSILDENGYVTNLYLKDSRNVPCDFVFDCTGFARVFVEKKYRSEFKSYKDFLPVKKAIPFFIEMDEKTPAFTEAISMKYGWMWKIPVKDRFGCGYVFDSDYIDTDSAYKEICDITGKTPDAPKVVPFNSGYFKTPWNKNVLAVGLSSGFIEPLEATSIWITTISLSLFCENISGLINRDPNAINEYNKNFVEYTDSVLNLVHLHYHNQRNDTMFWRKFKEKTKTPESLKLILEIFKYRLPSTTEHHLYRAFPSYSWYIVGAGNNFFSKDVIEKEYFTHNVESIADKTISFKNKLNDVVANCVEHDQFLNYLRNEN